MILYSIGNPTLDVFEKRIAALEGGVAAVAASVASPAFPVFEVTTYLTRTARAAKALNSWP
jgi:O-acetylhomoserine/O-acetylserine sulfhydrylase-like pyridoxal-dependent enzyme